MSHLNGQTGALESDGRITELSPGRLFALSNPYPVDGRVTWHPRDLRGVAPFNCYLLLEGKHALLIDTGLTIHRDALIQQLASLIDQATTLSIFHARLGEFASICNTPAVIDHFDVAVVYGQHAESDLWTDFEPHGAAGAEGFDHGIGAVEVRVLRSENELELGESGSRQLEAFITTLRLLPTYWVYDGATRTLFTSDMFSHVCRSTASESFVVTEEADDTSLETVSEHMLGTRYWWLEQADVATIAADLAALFQRYEIERIAPQYGCILEGRRVVERHLELVQSVLAGERVATTGGGR